MFLSNIVSRANTAYIILNRYHLDPVLLQSAGCKNYPKLSGLKQKMYSLTGLQARTPKSVSLGQSQGVGRTASSAGSREGCVAWLFQLLEATGIPYCLRLVVPSFIFKASSVACTPSPHTASLLPLVTFLSLTALFLSHKDPVIIFSSLTQSGIIFPSQDPRLTSAKSPLLGKLMFSQVTEFKVWVSLGEIRLPVETLLP